MLAIINIICNFATSLNQNNMRFYSTLDFLSHVEQHGLNFSGSLDLQGCTGLTSLPDNLTVGGSLDLQGCTGLTKVIHNCGDCNRSISPYNHKAKGRVISLGCFVGTKAEAIKAVRAKYSGQAALDYIAKIEQAFGF